MEFFESIEEIQEQVDRTRARLELLEQDVSRAQCMGRLRHAHPYHPVLLARTLFMIVTLLGIVLAMTIALLPFLQPDLARSLVGIETAVGVPLPIVLGLLAFCMGIAWLMATQAAIFIGRECPLLPWEKKERERLSSELSRLTRQRQMMERVRGTPMGARPRLLTPVPTSRTGPRTTGGAISSRGSSPLGGNAPSYAAPSGGYLGTGPAGPTRHSVPPRSGVTGSGAMQRARTPLGAAPRRGTPLGSSPRSNTPSSGWNRTATPPQPMGRRPTGGSPPAPLSDIDRPPEPLVDDVLPASAESPTEGYDEAFSNYEQDLPAAYIDDTDQDVVNGVPFSIENADTQSDDGPGAPSGEVEEWMIDAIEKAQMLADGFPVQARLAFNQAPGLPFTLVLERATPAMAVRAMMAFIEFLSSISTPPKARVELISVRHLDRSFHRNIKAALDPYFPGTAEVIKERDYIDIIFKEPDRRWHQFPYLPVS